MKFSVCIPNYNYARYLGRTIQSVLDQQGAELEILVSDNASTDDSLSVVRQFTDPRIKLQQNSCNIGFASNVERSARMATGDLMMMLSSDDLIRPGALACYQRLFGHLGSDSHSAIVSASWDIIDGEEQFIRYQGPHRSVWLESDRQPELEQLLEAKVYGVPAQEMLRRCLLNMRNPFNFAATCYASALFRQVEGYGSRLMNPDKWFHWKVLGVAKMAYFVDKKLFAYRWHASNQTNQQAASDSLKFMVDDYTSTLELDGAALSRAGISQDELLRAYVEFDVARHGLATLAGGSRLRAQRILDFGRAVYPEYVRRNGKARLLRLMLAMGPVGQFLTARAYRAHRAENGRS